ncbi:hypothetical protein [Glutamicibacter ardleyensis]
MITTDVDIFLSLDVGEQTTDHYSTDGRALRWYRGMPERVLIARGVRR